METTQTPGKLLIIEHQPMFLRGIINFLKRHTILQIQVCREKESQQILEQIQQAPEAILLVDLYTPADTKLDWFGPCLKMPDRPKIIAWVNTKQWPQKPEGLPYAIAGLLDKVDSEKSLIQAIQAVSKNEKYISPSIQNYFSEQFQNREFMRSHQDYLSNAQKRVYELIIQGYSTKEIAKKLFLSENTIKRHRQDILARTGANNFLELSRIF